MSDEKKIIVDEDWKTRVAAEKEAAQRGEAPTTEAGGDGGDAAPHELPADLPAASFELLVTMFATEAMVGLGQLPHPVSGKVEAEPEQARYAIDMLAVLSEKTKGNLTPAEERGLRDLLHQLRMAFIAVGKP